MFCPYCGTRLIEGASFCCSCGKKIPDEFLVSPATQSLEPEIISYTPNYTMRQLEQAIVLQLNTYRVCHSVGCLSLGDLFYKDCVDCTKSNLKKNLNIKESKDICLSAPENYSLHGKQKLADENQVHIYVSLNDYDITDAESLTGDLYHDCQTMTNAILSLKCSNDENIYSYSLDDKEIMNVSIAADILGNNLAVSLIIYGKLV